jgi:UDP-N-acetylglucosamine transferase subunit ALG13
MIFVTTGTQLAFPRLVDAMADLAPDLNEPIIAQIGPDTKPRPGLDIHANLTPAEFEKNFKEARVVVAHAGIGSILSAKRYGRPLVMMPRRFDLGEHRNDHQAATAKEVEGREGLYIAWDAEDLRRYLTGPALIPAQEGDSAKSAPLLEKIKNFIDI